jgi:hypothetical protein
MCRLQHPNNFKFQRTAPIQHCAAAFGRSSRVAPARGQQTKAQRSGPFIAGPRSLLNRAQQAHPAQLLLPGASSPKPTVVGLLVPWQRICIVQQEPVQETSQDKTPGSLLPFAHRACSMLHHAAPGLAAAGVHMSNWMSFCVCSAAEQLS